MIRFSSSAAGDVNMLDEHGQLLLDIIGKSKAPRGAITPEQISAAVAALRAASEHDRKSNQGNEAAEDSDDAEEKDRDGPRVGLGQRAFPLIELLERAAEKNTSVTWGV